MKTNNKLKYSFQSYRNQYLIKTYIKLANKWNDIRKHNSTMKPLLYSSLILTVGGISSVTVWCLNYFGKEMNSWILCKLRKLRRSVSNYFLKFWSVSSYHKTNLHWVESNVVILAPDERNIALFINFPMRVKTTSSEGRSFY